MNSTVTHSSFALVQQHNPSLPRRIALPRIAARYALRILAMSLVTTNFVWASSSAYIYQVVAQAGDTIGGATLTRFFVLHVFIFPAFIFAGVALHMWLILRHGISEMPKPGQPVVPATYKRDYEARLQKSGVPFWPNAMWRDAVVSLVVVVGIVACAVFFGPPVLNTPPDPTALNVNPAPDWYFLFYFAILSMLPANL